MSPGIYSCPLGSSMTSLPLLHGNRASLWAPRRLPSYGPCGLAYWTYMCLKPRSHSNLYHELSIGSSCDRSDPQALLPSLHRSH
ncbi:hypothetical protein BX666DRAFT_1902482 [Dichotomocladium elegans]|nr:hypothetical protein BX666DRAFT_1902482 [Dichotomocladium elegans]